MAKRRRPPIPRAILDEVLFRADHTCCICRAKGKDVQVHHIDGNNSNNNPGNLAVVCLDCHSKVTGARGLGRSYRQGEVRKYKRAWEQLVQWFRQIHRPQIRYKKELVSQIDLIICEVLALRSSSPRVKELLDTIYELHLWRGGREIDDKIIEGLNHLALMSGLSSPQLAALVAQKLWEMCWHFAGPKDVPMDARDESYVLRCFDALETLAQFNSEFGHGRRAATSIADSAENFFEVGLWYSRKSIVNAVFRAYEKGLRACYEGQKLEFPHGRRIFKKSLRRIRKLLKEEHPAWDQQLRRVDKLIDLHATSDAGEKGA